MKTPQQQWTVIGQNRAFHFLEAALRGRRFAHSYLFHGPNGVGKRTSAKLFLQTILCQKPYDTSPCGVCASCDAWLRGSHPDAIFLAPQPDARDIPVDGIRALIHQVRLRPTLSEYRVALLEDVERFSLGAANALLKTLEEPPEKTVLVLTTSEQNQIPLTVRSRCQEVGFSLVSQPNILALLDAFEGSRERKENISYLAAGRPGLAKKLFENSEEYQSYEERAGQLLSVLSAPLYERIKSVATLVPKDPAGQRNTMIPIIEVWMWLLRDTLLILSHSESLCVHRFLLAQLRGLARSMTATRLLRGIQRLADMKSAIQANVNPQLVLESFVVNV